MIKPSKEVLIPTVVCLEALLTILKKENCSEGGSEAQPPLTRLQYHLLILPRRARGVISKLLRQKYQQWMVVVLIKSQDMKVADPRPRFGVPVKQWRLLLPHLAKEITTSRMVDPFNLSTTTQQLQHAQLSPYMEI